MKVFILRRGNTVLFANIFHADAHQGASERTGVRISLFKVVMMHKSAQTRAAKRIARTLKTNAGANYNTSASFDEAPPSIAVSQSLSKRVGIRLVRAKIQHGMRSACARMGAP